MITIKLPYKSDKDFSDIRKQFSSVVRWSYNRFKEGMREKDVRHRSNTLNNTNLLDSWITQCAIMKGKDVWKRNKNNKVIFGSKSNFYNYIKRKITKEQYDKKRLLHLSIMGEAPKKGNRKFKLDVLDNNKIIFKYNSKEHYELELPLLRNNIKQMLYKLQLLNETNGYTYSIALDDANLYISFEEFKKKVSINLNEDRYMGIDLNPDSVGISIKEGDQILHLQEYSMKQIFNKILKLGKSSESKESVYYQNKLRFETLEISKSIASLAKQYRCKHVFIEDLNFKYKDKTKYNHVGNRKCHNLWKKNILITNLTKRLNVLGINLYEINPAYSSVIGNAQYNYTDAVNASLEIARRGYEIVTKKSRDGFYPEFSSSSLKHQWKETVNAGIKNWKELFLFLKNAGLKYRVPLSEVLTEFGVFSLNSKKSCVNLYKFNMV